MLITDKSPISSQEFYVSKRSTPRDTRWTHNDPDRELRQRKRAETEMAKPDEREHTLMATGGGPESTMFGITARASSYNTVALRNDSDMQVYGVCNGLDNWRKRFNDNQMRVA